MLHALVAEDEMLVRELLVEELGEAGFRVTAVASADDALAAIEGEVPFDLLFTDVRMPGSIDGWELGRRARVLKPGLKIIYATGYSDKNPQLSQGERQITKPFFYDNILSALSELDLR